MFQEISQNVPGTLEENKEITQNVQGYHSRFTRISFKVIQENALKCYRKSLNNSKNDSRKKLKFTRNVPGNDQEVSLNH